MFKLIFILHLFLSNLVHLVYIMSREMFYFLVNWVTSHHVMRTCYKNRIIHSLISSVSHNPFRRTSRIFLFKLHLILQLQRSKYCPKTQFLSTGTSNWQFENSYRYAAFWFLLHLGSVQGIYCCYSGTSSVGYRYYFYYILAVFFMTVAMQFDTMWFLSANLWIFSYIN